MANDSLIDVTSMDELHAAELLYRHNIWRRGDETYDMANPKELGIALDMAVKALRSTRQSVLSSESSAASFRDWFKNWSQSHEELPTREEAYLAGRDSCNHKSVSLGDTWSPAIAFLNAIRTEHGEEPLIAASQFSMEELRYGKRGAKAVLDVAKQQGAQFEYVD